MTYPYGKLLFTKDVRAFQRAAGSEENYARMIAAKDRQQGGDAFGPDEVAFVEARDGFYQATVSPDGWPYVQFRGGPAGFLRVKGAKTLIYADLRGNRQYISAGNIKGNNRVALFLMDYPNRRRMKIIGRTRFLSPEEAPGVLGEMMASGIKGRPERLVEITLEAFDWNCPAHIPQRFTPEEIEETLTPMRARITALESENMRLKAKLDMES